MTNETSSEDAPGDVSSDFPMAVVRERAGARRVFASKMWWVTLACAVMAATLAWQSIPAIGPTIAIEFPQGHGIKPGDALRHRGIDVGTVTQASLTDDLNGILVSVELNPEAEILCREGSRFWIVRPQVALTGVHGLETAVGSKYVAVSPGPPDASRQNRFHGLAMMPPDEFAGEGLELVLRGPHRSGLNPGAPVAWRGVDVGQVLSVGLSPDARSVDTGIRLSARYRRLVNDSTKFWVTSGFDVHVGLDGIELNAESLATLALGGVSLITPAGPAGDVRNGHVFQLHPTPGDDWLDNAASIPLVDVDLPQTVIVEGSVPTSFLGIARRRTFTATGMLVQSGNDVSLLTANLPLEDHESKQRVPELLVRRPGSDETVTFPATDISDESIQPGGIIMIPFPSPAPVGAPEGADVLRSPTAPEECCVARTVASEKQSSSVVHSFGRDVLAERDERWIVTDTGRTDLSAWNGAPVVSLNDGRVIGVLASADDGTAILPIPDALAP